MKSQQAAYQINLPNSIKAEARHLAKVEGISMNQLIVTAVAEKLAVMNTETFFAERRKRADFIEFDRIISRNGGEPPRKGEELPE